MVQNGRLFVETILIFVLGERVNCSLSNCILGTYCKGAAGKKGDEILVDAVEKIGLL